MFVPIAEENKTKAILGVSNGSNGGRPCGLPSCFFGEGNRTRDQNCEHISLRCCTLAMHRMYTITNKDKVRGMVTRFTATRVSINSMFLHAGWAFKERTKPPFYSIFDLRCQVSAAGFEGRNRYWAHRFGCK